MLLLSVAWAASVSALVEVGPGGPVLRDAVLIPEDAPSEPGPLRVLSADGQLLASAALDEALQRSILLPEGGGAAVVLEEGLVRVRVPWPEGASTVALGATTRAPRSAPPAEAVQLAGPSEERLDLVFLGDGYTDDELGLYADDVDRMVDYLLTIQPYEAYSGLFNIWRIDQASVDSGVSHQEGGQNLVRDTAYSCFYGCGGVDRLVCCDDSKVLGAVNDQVPQADGVLVLINDPVYGGSGGFNYATSYTDGRVGEQVAAHEIGHSLVGLWDEYSYGYPASFGDGPNCAEQANATPWEHWLDQPQVGAFELCSYTNYFRPTDDRCMMNTLQDGYCPVCREQAVLALYDRLPSLLASSSHEEDEVSLPAELWVETLGPDDGSQEVRWLIDGDVVGEGAQIALSCGPGEELTVQVRDPTSWVRKDPKGLLEDQRSWTLLPCEGAVDSGESDPPDRPGPPGMVPACGCEAGPSWSWIGLWPIVLLAGRRFRV